MRSTHELRNRDDDLDGDFIEEEWQFVRKGDDEDEDDEDEFAVAPRHVSFDDDADSEFDDEEEAGDDSADLAWDAGTEDEESKDEDEFAGWIEEPADPDEE